MDSPNLITKQNRQGGEPSEVDDDQIKEPDFKLDDEEIKVDLKDQSDMTADTQRADIDKMVPAEGLKTKIHGPGLSIDEKFNLRANKNAPEVLETA